MQTFNKFLADDDELAAQIKQESVSKIATEIETERRAQRIPESSDYDGSQRELELRLYAAGLWVPTLPR